VLNIFSVAATFTHRR